MSIARSEDRATLGSDPSAEAGKLRIEELRNFNPLIYQSLNP
jgi:hypothetical protein